MALYARQALPVGYIVLGAALGPWGFGLVGDVEILQGMAEFGIIFLLFLLGLNLELSYTHLLHKFAARDRCTARYSSVSGARAQFSNPHIE